jgi:molybdopterin/thiamine biosynthesis adenylyltransferase
LPKVQTLDQASLDRFTTDLIEAGFHAIGETDQRDWEGPTLYCLHKLTDAPKMLVRLRDGWPYVHPRVLVPGITGEHASADGIVCLWGEDDDSLEWRRWEGIVRRADEWCQRAVGGFRPIDFALDAYVGFENRDTSAIVTFNLRQLISGVAQDGKHQRIHGVAEADSRIGLFRGKGRPGTRAGRLFYRSTLQAPPRTRLELEKSLTAAQLSRLRADLARVGSEDPPIEFAVLAWGRAEAPDILVLRAKREAEDVSFASMEPAPSDDRTLLLRAGPDATIMGGKKVVIFGSGAIGSHLAVLLAECGLGGEHLVDGERLRPGNVVRHRAGAWAVGTFKVAATAVEIQAHAPWTAVTMLFESVSGPEDTRKAFAGCDLIVDATGNWGFQQQTARLAAECGIPLVTAALYRKGTIARVRRQAANDPCIWERTSDAYYLIPPDEDDRDFTLETGCSSPVSNAPPSSVAAVAALITQVVSDYLSGRRTYPHEIVDVYEPLPDPPFDRVGRLPWPKS